MNELALFAGGGFGLLGGMLLGWRTVAAVEKGEYQRTVLLQRQSDGVLPRFPIWDDITTFDGRPWRGKVHIVTGGFPCQYFSTASAGKRTAINLWPEMERVVREVAPPLVFCENVSEDAIVKAGLDLWTIGYSFVYTKVSAADMGADHIRDRFWLLAYSDNESKLLCKKYAEVGLLPKLQTRVWETGPRNRGVANGSPGRVERYQTIGNGQVPIVAARAWQELYRRIGY